VELNPALLFIVVTLGLGYGVLRATRAPLHPSVLLRGLEVAGIGLATFSFLGVVLHLFHVPLYWWIYVALACVGPVLALVPRRPAPASTSFEPVGEKEELAYGALLGVVLVAFFAVYYNGAHAYPYLEDEDPWMHAQGALYVATQHTYRMDSAAFRPPGHYGFYLEPYPPTYDVMMGVLRQVTDSVSSTLRLFNVVLCTLTIAFSFLFSTAYLRSIHKGFFAALVLAVLPSFMSHFIWSQSLALCVFPVALYAALRALDDLRWVGPAILSVASLMVTQPVVSIMGGMVLILLVGCLFLHERGLSPRGGIAAFPQTVRGFAVGAGGLLLSLVYWGAQVAKWGPSGIFGMKGGEFTNKWTDVYAGRSYSLEQLLFPKGDMIDQPSGWGPVLTLALIVGVLEYVIRQVTPRGPSQRAFTDLHLLVWFLLLFYLVFAPVLDLPAWGSWRAWAYLAFPVALLATEGAFLVGRLSISRDPRFEIPVIALAALGIVATSAPAKVELESSTWSPGQHWFYARSDSGTFPVGLGGYVRMAELLARNTRVYAFCGNGDSHTIAFDMESSPWDKGEAEFRRRSEEDVSLAEALQFLDAHHYAHFTFDASCGAAWGEPAVERFLQALGNEPRVKALYSENGFLLGELLPSGRAP
jgi:hypothetical protein